MEMQDDRSTERAATPEVSDELLRCRMEIMGLDDGAVENDYGAVFEKLSRHCSHCGGQAPCMADLTRDPTNPVWETYCPNAKALNALVALTGAIR